METKMDSIAYLKMIGTVGAILGGLILIPFLVFVYLTLTHHEDHIAAIPLDNNPAYYRNYGDLRERQVQDRDVFYHNIGKTIHYARKADIVIIGHSMLLWGLRADLIKEFERKHHVKIYNLGSAGDNSGEFLRRVINHWHIRPKMWIINADDHETSFFNLYLADSGNCFTSSAMEVVKYNHLKAYQRVVARNIRWRLEDLTTSLLPPSITSLFFAGSGFHTWRNAVNGSMYYEKVPMYTNPQNEMIKLGRSVDCHTTPTEIDHAKSYLSSIGGAPTVLMLVPYQEFCAQRVRELGKALNLEYILPPTVSYTSADHGWHLDKRGATAFTKFFLANLEKSETFKKIAPQ